MYDLKFNDAKKEVRETKKTLAAAIEKLEEKQGRNSRKTRKLITTLRFLLQTLD